MDRELARNLNARMVEIFNSVLEIETMALRRSTVSNLSITEIHTLDAIGTVGSKTMTQVASTLRVSVSTLTIAIGRLEKKGFVKRFRIEEDRRIVKVELTHLGREAVRQHESFHLEMVEQAAGSLSKEEQQILLQSLNNIRSFFRCQRNQQEEEFLKSPPVNRG